jgi:hypothetical protein
VADGSDLGYLGVAWRGGGEGEDSGGGADLVLGAVIGAEVGGYVDELEVDAAVGESVVSSAYRERLAARLPDQAGGGAIL